MIPGANHIALSVPDMDRAIAFYGELLGFEKVADAGMEFHSEPQETGLPGVRTVYGRDPFGNVVELEESAGRVRPDEQPGINGQ